MPEQTVRLTDNHTGAVIDGTLTFDPGTRRPPKARFTGGWAALFDAGCAALIDNHFTILDYKILLALIERADRHHTEWEVGAAATAARIGTDEARVYLGMRRLVSAGILIRTRKGFIRPNPDLIWKGSSEERATALQEASA